MSRTSLPLLVATGLCLVAGCQKTSPPSNSSQPRQPKAISANGLHNVYRLSEKLYSGGSPEGKAGFESLKQLGIKTIISVDGASPELDLANTHEMRYVHLPVQYEGIKQEKAWLIAKAVRDLPGPIYLHCHHGKHRGPSAAAAALLCLDSRFTAEQAQQWLKTAGIDPRYRGLVALPTTLARPEPGQLDAIPADFPSAANVPSFTQRMVNIDLHWDELKQAQANNWADPARASATALQLFEEYREMNRLKIFCRTDEAFIKMMQSAEKSAEQLEQALRQSPLERDRVQHAFQENRSHCNRCHTLFRD